VGHAGRQLRPERGPVQPVLFFFENLFVGNILDQGQGADASILALDSGPSSLTWVTTVNWPWSSMESMALRKKWMKACSNRPLSAWIMSSGASRDRVSEMSRVFGCSLISFNP